MKQIRLLTALLLVVISSWSANAHCDSYDGPVIKDALKALEENNVSLVLKWIAPAQEQEIVSLFNATYNLRNGNKEVYALVEKHFLETLVRLHRETEGAPYNGLKQAGTTKPIITMSDKAIVNEDSEQLIAAMNNHIAAVVRNKYNRALTLSKSKNDSPEKGREYVKAYVEFTHTVEGIHDIIDGEHHH